MFNRFWHSKVRDPIIRLLKQGLTPEKIALSLALGAVFGIFPVIGSTTLLCTAAAIVFRLNLPAIQIANYLAGPLQLGLLIPFYRAGELLFDRDQLSISLEGVIAMIQKDTWGAIIFLWDTTLCAIVAWAAVAPIGLLFLYLLLKPAIQRLPFKSAYQEASR